MRHHCLQDFVDWLWQAFPEKEDVLYTHTPEIMKIPVREIATAVPTALHVSSLGFDTNCSVKPPPGKDIVIKLVDQILMDGFITSQDAIQISQAAKIIDSQHLQAPWGDRMAGSPVLQPQSVGYVKGQARALSGLCVLYYCFLKDIKVHEVHPRLHESFCMVWVMHIDYGNQLEEGLANMKLSARGSIRRSNSVVQIVLMIQNITKIGSLTDPMSFVRKWPG